jgi:hypothetical protein
MDPTSFMHLDLLAHRLSGNGNGDRERHAVSMPASLWNNLTIIGAHFRVPIVHGNSSQQACAIIALANGSLLSQISRMHVAATGWIGDQWRACTAQLASADAHAARLRDDNEALQHSFVQKRKEADRAQGLLNDVREALLEL